ncbi:MAG: hypothetical protein HY731_10085 [Candidatus Tectomicrobia bacterium]|nr:hypothetical protein [Candidatus Tectomicrobia bacterium]
MPTEYDIRTSRCEVIHQYVEWEWVVHMSSGFAKIVDTDQPMRCLSNRICKGQYGKIPEECPLLRTLNYQNR